MSKRQKWKGKKKRQSLWASKKSNWWEEKFHINVVLTEFAFKRCKNYNVQFFFLFFSFFFVETNSFNYTQKKNNPQEIHRQKLAPLYHSYQSKSNIYTYIYKLVERREREWRSKNLLRNTKGRSGDVRDMEVIRNGWVSGKTAVWKQSNVDQNKSQSRGKQRPLNQSHRKPKPYETKSIFFFIY